jgi:hypothetical protein
MALPSDAVTRMPQMLRWFSLIIVVASTVMLIRDQVAGSSPRDGHPRLETGAGRRVQDLNDPLKQLRNSIFDIHDKISDFGKKDFVLILRFTKTAGKPDSQVIITRFHDGHTELLIEELQRPLAAYLTDDFPEKSLNSDQLRAIAIAIPVQRTLLKSVPDNIEKLLSQFTLLDLSPLPNDGLPLDGTQYDLWYAVPAQTLHMSQHGPTVGSASARYQPVRWMNEVYGALKQNNSARLTR